MVRMMLAISLFYLGCGSVMSDDWADSEDTADVPEEDDGTTQEDEVSEVEATETAADDAADDAESDGEIHDAEDGGSEVALDTEDGGPIEDAETEVDADPCPSGWIDPATSLCWEIPTMTMGVSWTAATDTCAGLADVDGLPWRMPTISELRTLVRGCPATESGGACRVTDDCLSTTSCAPCDYCTPGFGPAGGFYSLPELDTRGRWYWSSSLSDFGDPDPWPWGIGFNNGAIYPTIIDCADGTGSCTAICTREIGL